MYYTVSQLSEYPFFENLLQNNDIVGIHDSLTKLIARPYIIEFIKSLIADKVSFSLSMLDIDNFKFVNDTYGHISGDHVLEELAGALKDYVGDKGLVGRYGGDEFLIVNLCDTEYDDNKIFYEYMYTRSGVVRANYDPEISNTFVTATIGCASYPKDADSYESLFGLIDKTLYRGKSKGRNCYIIYVEEKHKDIEIRELSGHGIYKTMYNITKRFDNANNTPEEKLVSLFDAICVEMRITDLYYSFGGDIFRGVMNTDFVALISGVDTLLHDDMYTTNLARAAEGEASGLFMALKPLEAETVLMVKSSTGGKNSVYLMCAEPRSLRIWQEEEFAILLYAARLLSEFHYGI